MGHVWGLGAESWGLVLGTTGMRPDGTHWKDQISGCQEGLSPGWGLTLELEKTWSCPTVQLPPGAWGVVDALRTY